MLTAGRFPSPETAMPSNKPPRAECMGPGPIQRREFLRVGLSGFASLSLPGLFQLRARAAASPSAPAGGKPGPKTAVILVWLRGGVSHLETYDPKPEAPEEVRGVYGTIPTRVPGLRLGELLPRHAKIADKFTL